MTTDDIYLEAAHVRAVARAAALQELERLAVSLPLLNEAQRLTLLAGLAAVFHQGRAAGLDASRKIR